MPCSSAETEIHRQPALSAYFRGAFPRYFPNSARGRSVASGNGLTRYAAKEEESRATKTGLQRQDKKRTHVVIIVTSGPGALILGQG